MKIHKHSNSIGLFQTIHILLSSLEDLGRKNEKFR